MKVLGWTDETTVCDCCGKSNLRGTFGVETDAGEVLHYGSVCVAKVYGKRRASVIINTSKAIAAVQSMDWDRAINRLSFGHFQPLHAFIGDKPAWNNSGELMGRADSIRDLRTGHIVKTRAAA